MVLDFNWSLTLGSLIIVAAVIVSAFIIRSGIKSGSQAVRSAIDAPPTSTDKLHQIEGKFLYPTLDPELAIGLFEDAPDAIIVVDADGNIWRVNKQAESLFGYGRTELIGNPVHVLLPETLRAKHIEHVAGYVATPYTRPMGAGLELFGQHKDGAQIPIDINLSPSGRLFIAFIRRRQNHAGG